MSLMMTTATQVGRERETANTWDKFLDHVKARVSINTFTTWFQPTKLNRAQRELFEKLRDALPVENEPAEKGLFEKVKDYFM